MEYKEKKARENDYRLRKREEDRENILKGYEPSEKEKEEEKAPLERLRAESETGSLSAGFSGEKKEKVVLLVSQDKEAQARREEKNLKREGARPEKVEGKRVLTNSHNPEKSAALFELDSSKNKKRLLSEITALMEKKGNETVSGLLPYLEEKEEAEQIQVLEDEARKSEDPVRVEQNRRLAGRLREDQRKKEEQKQRLLKMLETNLETEQEKAPRFPWELLLGMAAAFLSGEQNPDQPPEEQPGPEKNPSVPESRSEGQEETDERKEQPDQTSIFTV